MLTNDQIKSLTDDDLETLSLQLKAEQKQRKNAKVEAIRNKTVEALSNFFDSGGCIEIEGNDGYSYLECYSSQDIKATSPDTITLFAG